MTKVITRQPIIDKCEGCDNVVGDSDAKECRVYPNPAHKWSVGHCNMATHFRDEAAKGAKILNPMKASKLKAKGRG